MRLYARLLPEDQVVATRRWMRYALKIGYGDIAYVARVLSNSRRTPMD